MSTDILDLQAADTLAGDESLAIMQTGPKKITADEFAAWLANILDVGLTAEDVRDTVANALVPGSGINIVHNDELNTITITATGGLDTEAVRDVIGTVLIPGTGINLTVDDEANTITVTATGGGGGGSLTDGDKGDVVVSGSGATWTVDTNAITLSKMAQLATGTILGRTTAGTGNVEALTATQLTAMLNVGTSTLKGLAPASGGGTTNFLRADYTWAAPAGSTFTQSGANAVTRTPNDKLLELPKSPEDFVATAGTGGNDTLAFQRLAAAINAAGGGVILLGAGKTYIVGQQTMGAASGVGTYANYTGVPQTLLDFTGCTKPIIIIGNGAKIKCASGLKYGTFNSSGSATSNTMPYYGAQKATPYFFMISATGCSGFIHIENLELDGNLAAQTIGGGWGDVGWQIPMTGLGFYDNTGGIYLSGVKSHHHGQDGIVIDGVAPGEGATSEQIDARGCKFDYNGRLGMAYVAGRNAHFHQCTFNWNANASAIGSTVSSAPATGVDFEAEAGKYNRDVTFTKCDFVGNYQQQIVADSATPTSRVGFKWCRFVQTTNGKYCAWPNRPGFSFEDSLFAGTLVLMHADPLKPTDNARFHRCTFSNSNEYSPTGNTGTFNNLLFDGGNAGVLFTECLFEHNKPADTYNTAGVGTPGIDDKLIFKDCTVLVRQNQFALYGRWKGKTEFIVTGGSIFALPGPPTVAFVNAGYAEGRFGYTVGGTRTEYPATFDPIEGKPIYRGTATYDPPSLAAGAKTSTQTMTVTGVAVGDRIVEKEFSVNRAGARIEAWVSGANTVSYYFVNENGANPLDLASGTVRVKVIGA